MGGCTVKGEKKSKKKSVTTTLLAVVAVAVSGAVGPRTPGGNSPNSAEEVTVGEPKPFDGIIALGALTLGKIHDEVKKVSEEKEESPTKFSDTLADANGATSKAIEKDPKHIHDTELASNETKNEVIDLLAEILIVKKSHMAIVIAIVESADEVVKKAVKKNHKEVENVRALKPYFHEKKCPEHIEVL